MANITINDIKTSTIKSSSEMEQSKGGWYWGFLYQNVFNPYTQPFGYAIQQQTFNTARIYDSMNRSWLNNFMSS